MRPEENERREDGKGKGQRQEEKIRMDVERIKNELKQKTGIRERKEMGGDGRDVNKRKEGWKE